MVGTSFREEIHNILYDIQNKYQTHWKEHENKLQEVFFPFFQNVANKMQSFERDTILAAFRD